MQHPKRSLLVLGALLVITPLMLGMGSMGGRDVIHPAVDFHATLVDTDGTTVEVNRLNIGGDVQLEGDMGRGTLRIAFDNIKRIELSPDSHDFSKATVQLKNGSAVTLRVRNSLMIYGQTTVGIYQIRARDLQSIQFQS